MNKSWKVLGRSGAIQAIFADQAAIAQADQLGDQIARALARAVLVYLHVQREEWGLAAALAKEYAMILEGADNRLARVMFGPTMADAARGAGQVGRAAEMIDASLTLARETGAPHFEGVALRVQSGVLAEQGRSKEATPRSTTRCGSSGGWAVAWSSGGPCTIAERATASKAGRSRPAPTCGGRRRSSRRSVPGRISHARSRRWPC